MNLSARIIYNDSLTSKIHLIRNIDRDIIQLQALIELEVEDYVGMPVARYYRIRCSVELAYRVGAGI